MADVHIKESLDWLDKTTIMTYRLGMVLTGIALFSFALQQLFYPLLLQQILIIMALGALLQASSLHIYSKMVRWFLVNATWMGCWLLSVSLVSTSVWTAYFSFGAFVITLSGLAYKESFCFSLRILKATPMLLVASWLMIILSLHEWAAVFLIASSCAYLYMAWRKINMPLHFDLGDRRKYEI